MKLIRFLFVITILLALTEIAYAYELSTHGTMTQAAFQRSLLSNIQFRIDAGIPDGEKPFGEVYFDISSGKLRERSASTFEGKIISRDLGGEPLSISGWLMRGAIREDDYTFGPNPWFLDPDLPYSIVRVKNHFFDPINRRGLNVPIASGEMAPQWAVGSTDIFSQPNQPNTSRLNHYTVFDAREAMYRALTQRTVDGAVVAVSGKSPADVRKAYWATTFRALGDVVHLVQDMAQPQHTRNDSHSGLPYGGDKSVYEKYIEDVSHAKVYWTASGLVLPAKRLVTTGYPIPQLSNYLAYFSSSKTDSWVLDRKGLADYSNRSFFTIGKNYDDTNYIYPKAFPLVEQLTWSISMSGTSGVSKYLVAPSLPDSLGNPAATNVPIATKSMWSSGMEAKMGTPIYTLTTKNYDAMADQLTPRAVAYSAGLLNYFFRGQIDLIDDPIHPGAYVLQNLGNEQMKGNFTLYYDTADGNRYPVAGDTPNITWAARTIEAISQIDNLTFTPPTVTEFPGQYMLVFNGDMGEEKATEGLTVGAVVGKVIGGEPYLYLQNTNSGLTARMSPNGDLSPQVVTIPPEFYTDGLAVYKSDVFQRLQTSFKADGLWLDINGIVGAHMDGAGNGIAVNKTNVFLTQSYGDRNEKVQVNIFDHQGVLQSIVQTNPDYEFLGGDVRIAANNTHFATTQNEYLYIYTKDGTNIATISGLNIYSQQVAMTKDRVYYVNGAPESLTLQIYDLYGGLQGSVDVTGILGGSVNACIAATENRLYIASFPGHFPSQLHIFKRSVGRDPMGNITSDNYVYWKAIPLDITSCAVDAAYLK